MRLIDLHIQSFGKFHNRDISFSDGINIIYGKNEAGKSTLHTFIRGMFYGLEPGRGRAARTSIYNRFRPWDQKGSYEGSMRVEHGGKVYRIERDFSTTSRELNIVNETDGIAVISDKAFLEEIMGGLSETAYRNTISISQLKSATDNGMVTELKNYIANLNNSGSMSLNITRATDYLKAKRKELEDGMIPEAAKEYAALAGAIRSLEQEIQDPRYENQIPVYKQMQAEVHTQMEEIQERKEALIQKAASGRQILENNHFTDQASISEYQKQTQEAYESYLSEQRACRRKLPFLLFLFVTLAGLGLCAFAGYGIAKELDVLAVRAGSLNLILNPVHLAGAGILLLVAGLSLYSRRKQHKKDYRIMKKLLEEVFARHLTDTAITDEAMNAFKSRMGDFLRLHAAILQSELEVGQLSADLTKLREDQQSCGEEMELQQRNQWDLEQKLEKLNECKDKATGLKAVIDENERLQTELEAISLAQDTIEDLSGSIRNSFGFYLNQEASRLIDSITGGIYSSMSVDEDMNVFLNTKNRLVPLEQVSSGTIDQVYLALRLATANLIQADGARLPLIFDDSFVLYDDERLSTALKWLSSSFRCQILLFTCHRREAQMLKDNGIPYNLIGI